MKRKCCFVLVISFFAVLIGMMVSDFYRNRENSGFQKRLEEPLRENSDVCDRETTKELPGKHKSTDSDIHHPSNAAADPAVPAARGGKDNDVNRNPAVQEKTDNLDFLFDEHLSTADRIRYVGRISGTLSDSEQQKILDYIQFASNSSGEYVVKNNLLNRLIAQETLMADLASALIAIADDKNQDIVVRAYIVQHLRALYERNYDTDIKAYLYKALTEENNEISGGAMLALNYLMNQEEYGKEFAHKPVIQQARQTALDNNANNNNRITAIQIAAVKDDPELADGLRKIIST